MFVSKVKSFFISSDAVLELRLTAPAPVLSHKA